MSNPSDGVKLCGKTLHVGDYVRVEYMSGDRMKGAEIYGVIVELWPKDGEGLKQAMVESGWCFHDHDRILVHKPVSLTPGPH